MSDIKDLLRNGFAPLFGIASDQGPQRAGNHVAVAVNPDTGAILIDGASLTVSSASVGANGAAVPTSSDLIGFADGSGNTQQVSSAHPLPVAASFSAADMSAKSGSASSATTLFTVSDCTGFAGISGQLTAFAAASVLVGEISNDGTSWAIVADEMSGASSLSATGEFFFPTPAKQFRLRQSVYGGSGTSTASANLRANSYTRNINLPPNAAQESGGHLAAIDTAQGAVADAAWASGNGSVIALLKGIFGKIAAVVTALGSPFQAGGSIGNTAFAISGTLPAFAATPAVKIDQTTPGTTDSVTISTAQGAGAAIGAVSGAAVITDANGTIQQYLRGLIKQWIAGTLVLGASTNVIGHVVNDAGTAVMGKVGIDQTTPGTTDSVTLATGQGAGAAIGAVSGAAVITDANGTIQQYLRGLIKQWIAGTLVLGASTNVIGHVINDASSAVIGHVINDAGSAIIGKVGIDQTTPGTTNAVATSNLPTTVDTNSGNKSASTLRVVLATDQPALTNALTVNPSDVTNVLLDNLTAKVLVATGTLRAMDYYFYNPNATAAYLQCFDASATSGVTLGATVPNRIIVVPPASAANLSGLNWKFTSGLVIAATTTARGSTPVGTGIDGSMGYR